MKKFYIFTLILVSAIYFGQEKENLKLNFFGGIQTDIGLDLGSIIRKPENPNDYYSTQDQFPTYFTYGFTAQVGYQPLNWLALATGIRYSYISPKFHNIYWSVQPYFFMNNLRDKDFEYLTLNFGKQINSTQGLSNNGFIGIGAGKIDLMNERIAQKFQLNLDVQVADDAIWFVGFSYGITFFGNKNL